MKPDYIRSNGPDSFGRYTICNRLPRIIDDIIANNGQHVSKSQLQAFADRIPELKIEEIARGQTEFALFNTSIVPFLNQSIFDAPFFTAEMYFYQLLAYELGYHATGHDYFATLKHESLTEAIRFIAEKPDLPFPEDLYELTADAIAQSLHLALWGNLADLSLFTLSKHLQETSLSTERILIDQSAEFVNFFKTYKGRVHVFLDNAGYELVSDLYMIAVMLANPDCQIRIHVKPIPMFVSDTTAADWQLTLAAIRDFDDSTTNKWYSLLGSAAAGGRISLTTDAFWPSAHYFSDHWFSQLGIHEGELVISKGDLNYRRFFEDRSWPNTTPSEAAISTSSTPVLFLRTLKSEVMTGLDAATIQQLDASEPDWKISGSHGIIQFLQRKACF